VAPFIDGLDGLGALGGGAHEPGERVNLSALAMQIERAAVLLHRPGWATDIGIRTGPAVGRILLVVPPNQR